MAQEDVKFNNQRLTFSKNVKRKVLLDIARGVNPKEALLRNTNLSLAEISNDKKYASKLLYKWRRELYANKKILSPFYCDLNLDLIEEQIEEIGEIDDYNFDLQEEFEELKLEFLRIL